MFPSGMFSTDGLQPVADARSGIITMPCYDYRCEKCGEVVEIHKRIGDPHPAFHCAFNGQPACGGPLEQVIHAPAIRFKGPGFYVNDYGRGK